MDPQRTWNDLLNAWQNREWELVIELAEALRSWLDKGGFPPEPVYPMELGVEFNAAIARAATDFAARRARSVLDDPLQIPRDVPFSLCCSICHNIGPTNELAARASGWSNIQYFPTGIPESFRGTCPSCNGGKERSS